MEGRRLSVVVFGAPRALVAECDIWLSRGGRASVRAVRDLRVACRVVDERATDLLVLAKDLPFWDRDVIAERAERAGVPFEWWTRTEDPRDLARVCAVRLEHMLSRMASTRPPPRPARH